MAWIVKVEVDGKYKFLATSQRLPRSYAHVEVREKVKHFNTEIDASETAAFRGCRKWKTEKVD